MMISSLPKKTFGPILPYSIPKALVALEFGETDHSILDYLQFLTAQIATRSMSILHAFPDASVHSGIFSKDPMSLEHKEFFLGRLQDYIEQLVRSKFPRKRNFSFGILEGDPLELLLEKAEKENPSLIIIGKKSNQQFHGILAKNLARQIQGNALVIPEHAAHRLDKILVPIDFSTASGIALRTAIGMNKSLVVPTEIHVIHVATLPDIGKLQTRRTPEELKTILQNNIQVAFEVFLKKFAVGNSDNIRFTIEFQVQPDPAQFIKNYAQKNQIDLIAMGAKGFTNSSCNFLGSVTERLLDYNLPIPTFILK